MASLKALTHAKPTVDEQLATMKEMAALPDRAIAIIITAPIEDGLEDLILTTMIYDLNKTDKDGLFSGEAPLARFSSKIRLGFALGLFGRETRRDLDRLRMIRNAFAHARKDISFKTAEVAAICRAFELPDNPRFPPLDPKRPQEFQAAHRYKPPTDPRARFLTTALFMESKLWLARAEKMPLRVKRISEHLP
jgi:DNA-binding MltR family transcriptional regulator